MDAYFSGGLYRIAEDGEKEWFFPPMEPGIVYRTPERYMGKPVYTGCVDVGALPNATKKTVFLNNTLSDRVISVTGSYGYTGVYNGAVYNDEFPLMLGDGITSILTARRGDHTHIVINTNKDMSNYSAFITLKFTR